MTSKELETKLRAEISDDIRIKEHPKLVGISNVFWRTDEICPCPTFDIRDTYDASYTFEFPNGYIAPHNSVESVVNKVTDYINFMQSPDGDQFKIDEAKLDPKVNIIEQTIQPLNEGSFTV